VAVAAWCGSLLVSQCGVNEARTCKRGLGFGLAAWGRTLLQKLEEGDQSTSPNMLSSPVMSSSSRMSLARSPPTRRRDDSQSYSDLRDGYALSTATGVQTARGGGDASVAAHTRECRTESEVSLPAVAQPPQPLAAWTRH
jgi:hypothetical protein